jgi:thioredoxin-dependent peroxiredoxin
MLKQGSKAPKIELLDQNGKPWSLAAQGKKKVLVYFYPKADTPGCTTQSCGLRDIKADIGRTAIIGISPDKPEKQKKFDDKYELGFPLLADTEHTVAEAFKSVEREVNVWSQVHGH